MTTDPVRLLEILRPDPALTGWAEDEQDLVRQRIINTPAPPAPRRSRRRLAAGIAATFVAVAGGAGVATATGLMPSAFTDATSQSFLEQPLAGQSGIDPSTAERLATTTPGPDGTTFSVFVARGEGTYVCTTSLFEPSPVSGPAPGPGPLAFGGSVCQTATENGPYGLPFGEGGRSYMPHYNAFMIDVPVGDAVRAEVRTATGRVIPMIPAEGWFWGWAPNELDPARFPTLTGYAADGSVLATSKISGVTPYTLEELNRS